MSETIGLLRCFRGDHEITIPLEKEIFILGRSPEADMPLMDDQLVSRKHCKITTKMSEYFIEDMGSRNGTYLNGEKLSKARQLKVNDVIEIGIRKIVYFRDRRAAASMRYDAVTIKTCAQCGGIIKPGEIKEGIAEQRGSSYICSECSAENRLEGKIFHNYEIIGKVAQGGMGVIYKAKHRILDMIYAIKMIRESSSEDKDMIKRFLREVKLGSMVKHANIIKFIDAGREAGNYYLVMEYCEGVSLEDKLKEGKPLIELAPKVTGQIFDAVDAIHCVNLVHRDIKPANILVLKDGNVKLIDFGLVKQLSEEGNSVLTSSGMGIGSPYYIPPEQMKNARDADRRADIYALGATLYHMVCAVPPITGKTMFDFVRKMKEFNIKHPCEVNPLIPQGIGDWLMTALEEDPENRFQTIQEFRDAYAQAKRSN